MEINYSSFDTIEKYNKLFKEFCDNGTSYNTLTSKRKLIDFVGGLGLSNSIHERFVKSVLFEYKRRYRLSNTKRNNLIKRYKSPKKIQLFADIFELDLNEGFNLMKNDIQDKYPLIDNVDNLLSIISEQRDIRNDYLHGDFNFDNAITFEFFIEHLIKFQEIHSFTFKIFKYSFNNKINELPQL